MIFHFHIMYQEGMFLLMGIGYVVAGSVLISEAIGGFANKCRKIARRMSTTSVTMDQMTSHPNSMVTGKTDDKDESLGSGIIFSSSRNNSPGNVLRRRQSEQISGRTAAQTRRGHQRHNSLVEVRLVRPTTNSRSISMLSVKGIDETESIDNSLKSCDAPNGVQEHAVEINRVQTPYSYIDESFGEKIVHST